MQPSSAAGNHEAQLSAKQAIRGMVRAARAAATADPGNRGGADEALALAAVAMAHLASAVTVAVYVSLPREPDTGPLRTALAARGTRVLLPWLRDDLDLDWVHDGGRVTATERPAGTDAGTVVNASRAQLMRPPGPLLGLDAAAGADVIVLPALAVDTAGRRLGQGGGSYDRTLARLGRGAHRPLLVACVRDTEVFDAASNPLPEEPHDQRIDAVLTPTRWLPLPPPR